MEALGEGWEAKTKTTRRQTFSGMGVWWVGKIFGLETRAPYIQSKQTTTVQQSQSEKAGRHFLEGLGISGVRLSVNPRGETTAHHTVREDTIPNTPT